MPIKKYSDFDSSNLDTKTSSSKITEKHNDIIENTITEDLLLTPKYSSDDNLSIEILEEKIIKFNGGHINDIMETIKNKYSDTNYFIRNKDNQLHIVKYNEKLNLNINEFVQTLLKFYSSKNELRNITEGIKVKGNNNFSILENLKSQYTNKFLDDLIKLLSKK